MLLLRTDTEMGAEASTLSIDKPSCGRTNLRVAGRAAEPVIDVVQITKALADCDLEQFRPLLPVGYNTTAEAYRRSVSMLTTDDLTNHYTGGLDRFHNDFVPFLKSTLQSLSGGWWNLEDYIAFASGSDVDLMAHIINATTVDSPVTVYPGDWFGFQVGANQPSRVQFTMNSGGTMACICVPSVRNGHLTVQMLDFLKGADSCLLNINLFPTLEARERHSVSEALSPILAKSIISVSFSRGFGLTASQIGIVLMHREHPFARKFQTLLKWFTYFNNAIACEAFKRLDFTTLAEVDQRRRCWVENWLSERGLPVVGSGSYYVKSFRSDGRLPDRFAPLVRDGLLRLCFKPQIF